MSVPRDLAAQSSSARGLDGAFYPDGPSGNPLPHCFLVTTIRAVENQISYPPLKEILRLISIPEEQSQFERECSLIIEWYNEHRPHDTLEGKTPNEAHFLRPPANEQPRLEPRKRWPRGSPCAGPQVDIAGEPGDPIVLEIDCLEGRKHLPILSARHAA